MFHIRTLVASAGQPTVRGVKPRRVAARAAMAAAMAMARTPQKTQTAGLNGDPWTSSAG